MLFPLSLQVNELPSPISEEIPYHQARLGWEQWIDQALPLARYATGVIIREIDLLSYEAAYWDIRKDIIHRLSAENIEIYWKLIGSGEAMDTGLIHRQWTSVATAFTSTVNIILPPIFHQYQYDRLSLLRYHRQKDCLFWLPYRRGMPLIPSNEIAGWYVSDGETPDHQLTKLLEAQPHYNICTDDPLSEVGISRFNRTRLRQALRSGTWTKIVCDELGVPSTME